MEIQKSVFRTAFEIWLPLAVVIVIMTGTFYAAVQQNYRLSANDPQIQIAQDVAAALTSGQAPPEAVVPPTPTTEIIPSLSTFVAIYSATGTPIGSSASLDGKLPVLPVGVFDFAQKFGENRFTWQPKPGARFAAIVVYFSGKSSGYVMAARSLREVELREKQLAIMSVTAGMVALILSYGIIYYLGFLKFKSKLEESSGTGDKV